MAYIKALAARAGFSTAVPEPDRDSVDVRIMAGGPRRPALDLQLKATADLAETQDGFRRRFRVGIEKYDGLPVETWMPPLLVWRPRPSPTGERPGERPSRTNNWSQCSCR